MNLEMILKDLIAFKGNKFIYSKSCSKCAEPVIVYKMLSSAEMKVIDENEALLIAQD